MTVSTSAGTTLALSAAAPASYTWAGYSALTFTSVAEISDLGDIPARVYEIVTWRNMSGKGETKAKGGYSLGSQTLVFGADPKDAGQALLDAAMRSDDVYSIRISSPGLGDIYARAIVAGGLKSYGDINTVATRQVTLEYTIVSQAQDGLVVVLPGDNLIPPGALRFSDGTVLQFSDGSYLELSA